MDNLPFGFDKPKDSPGFLLWQTTLNWQRLIKKTLELHDISHAQFVIMALLLWWKSKKKNAVQIDLIKMSKLDKMTVSKSLKKLGEMKLVKRRENRSDTRSKIVCLTERGIELVVKLVPLVESIDEDFFGKLNNNKQKELIAILQTLAID